MPECFMPFTAKRPPVTLSAEQKQELEKLHRSRTGEKRGVQHAAILLDAAAGMSDGAVARRNAVNRHTVALCVRKFLQFGLEAALGELANTQSDGMVASSCSAGWKRRWGSFPGRARAAVFRMTRSRGCCTAPARNRKNWAI